jgi:hypothetical protein
MMLERTSTSTARGRVALIALSSALGCGQVSQERDDGSSGGSPSAGGQSGAAGAAVSGGRVATGGEGTSGAIGGSAPLPEGCFGLSPDLTSEELVSRVQERLGVALDVSRFDDADEKPAVRGLRLTEAIDEAVRDAGPPPPMTEILYDFIVQQLLHDENWQSGIPAFAADLSPEVAADMDQEFRLAISSWLQEGRATLGHMLTDNTAFVNPGLAAHYDIASPSRAEFSPVALPREQQMGLLTRGAFLARYTDPPARAPHLVQALECMTLPPPPALTSVWDQPNRAPAKEVIAKEYGDDQANCAMCHRAYVGYAIALDRYDELGRYRDTLNGLSIDTSGQLYVPDVMPATGGSANIEFATPQELGRALAESSTVRQCLATRLAAHLGLPQLETKDLACVMERFDASNASLIRLLAILAPRLVALE